ncbi:hypothetical protein F4677DRAFT_426522 [Hypoxylon crocopeplum]|nr:hypothetical protein F4677DRAFT_426522 [Hypoxylon crocopeplum]
MVQRSELKDIDLSIRLKHGIHTVFLFVDPIKTFGDIAEELLEILQERYPAGLTTSVATPDKTELPNDHLQIEFAVPKAPADLSQGWTPLKLREHDTPASKGIKDNSILAFAFRPQDTDEDYEVQFEVDLPSFEEDYEDQ